MRGGQGKESEGGGKRGRVEARKRGWRKKESVDEEREVGWKQEKGLETESGGRRNDREDEEMKG